MAVAIEGDWFEKISCGECGITFYAPDTWVTERRDKGAYGARFHCPNGHSRVWRESTLDQVRRERDRLLQERAQLNDRITEEKERAAKAERSVARAKKRAAAGTCPCCQRTFANMATHMKKQHPGYVQETGAKVVPIKAQSS